MNEAKSLKIRHNENLKENFLKMKKLFEKMNFCVQKENGLTAPEEMDLLYNSLSGWMQKKVLDYQEQQLMRKFK